MNINDFRYMWRGISVASLTTQQASLLAPFERHNAQQRRALLLLHGFASSPAVYRKLLPTLTMYDAVICPSLPGHCMDIASFTRAKNTEWIAAAEKACETLLQTYASVDVMGLSLGGLLACHLSQRFPLAHLYLLAPALVLYLNMNMSINCARLLQWLGFQYLRNYAGNIHVQNTAELTYRQLPITAIIEILTLVKHFKFIPPTCPVDLFLGRYDEVVNSSSVANQFKDLPNVQIHWLDNSAHVLPLDGDIDTIIACLRANHKL
jgi:carboxylesterase